MKGYFDYNATTPLHPMARQAWLTASDQHWQNASSLYREAAAVRYALDDARETLAEWLGLADHPERIIFTSGATESNNALAAIFAKKYPQGELLTSSLEHPSLREPFHTAFRDRVQRIRTQDDTIPNLEDFHQHLKSRPFALVSVMAASNESGTLLPWQEMAAHCRELGIPFHTDASQWIGKMPTGDLGECDYITGSAHKFGGPKGIGFLVMQNEDEALSFLKGGPQEEGRRAGTENYPAVAAMLAALENAVPPDEADKGRQQFEALIKDTLPEVRIIGNKVPRLWNTSMLIMPAHDNRKWLARLNDRGFSLSTGSACSGGQDGSSIVLSALGASPDEMRRVLRVSSGWNTREQDWMELAEAFGEVAHELATSPLQRQNRKLF